MSDDRKLHQRPKDFLGRPYFEGDLVVKIGLTTAKSGGFLERRVHTVSNMGQVYLEKANGHRGDQPVKKPDQMIIIARRRAQHRDLKDVRVDGLVYLNNLIEEWGLQIFDKDGKLIIRVEELADASFDIITQ